MCGIFGLIQPNGNRVGAQVVRRVTQVLEHRGPDDHGWLAFGCGEVQRGRELPDRLTAPVVLVHRRLSILDLSEAGWQPMSTPDGRYHLVFNGEIYNYLELRCELERLGWRFHSHSDTEVLLYAYAEWGKAVLTRLVGMFAFAVLDTRERRLFLARDFFGIKPLYYAHGPWGFAFASEIKALLELSAVPRRVNPPRLHEYLRSGMTDHGCETLYEGVRQLPGGHHLDLPLEAVRIPEPVRYWRHVPQPCAEVSFEEAAERLRELFLESVRLHLRSDVTVGAALSGGIDSSAIIAAMRHLQPELELHTFSYTAEDAVLSEERWVDIAGGAVRAVVHKVRPTVEELLADLDHLIAAQDEPFGSTSIYAQHRVFRLAREAGIKVMLDGQGADELLAGYSSYLVPRLASLVRRQRWAEAARFLRHLSATPRVPARAIALSAGVMSFPASLERLVRQVARRDRPPEWLNARWFEERGVVVSQPPERAGRDRLHHWLAGSLEIGLPALLRFEDRNSMAHSIESRVPFLTPQLWEFVHSLPEEYLIAPDGTSKAVFRRALRGIVPDAILDRRDKVGFETPEHRWLSALRPWVEGVLRSEAAAAIPALNHSAMLAEWEAVLQGGRPFDFRVWRWINLIRWAELHGVEMSGAGV